MKVLVPIKRVPDPYAKLRPLADGSALDLTSVKFEINPFDEIALEAAVRLREAGNTFELLVVSIGAAEAEEQLRKALAMGADRAILLETSTESDSDAIASALAQLVKDEAINLILMGKQATDDDNNQVAQRLAGKLGWPQATFAAQISLSPSEATVHREVDLGEEVVTLPLPCVISADLRLAEPRYIALPGIIKARSKPLEKRPIELSPPKLRVVEVSSAPERSKGQRVESVSELVAALSAKGAL